MEEIKDGAEVQETTAEVVEETTEETPKLSDEEIADLKDKASVSSQNFERAKKAEAELKEAREKLKETNTSQEGLSNKDVLFLAKADIHEDDLDLVTEEARIKKMPVSEAYKFLKPILDVKAEERKTASATQSRGGMRGASKVTGDDLVNKFEQTGDVPETNEGITAFYLARQARRKK